MPLKIRIGSRPSRLALAQTEMIRARLAVLTPGMDFEVVPIRTSGDRMTSASLAQVGGKGLFIKELEQALAAHKVDLAVHSMKDLPAVLPEGFRIAAVPEREDVRDALIVRVGRGLSDLPRGARLGTSSSRRRFEALRLRPDLKIHPLRGNVDTRLDSLAGGALDAIVVAVAGLKRLGRFEGLKLEKLGEEDFVPAGGQGALAIEALAAKPAAGLVKLESALERLNHPRTAAETVAERAFLAAIGASCVSPVGVLARIEGGTLRVRARLFSIDGAKEIADSIGEPFDVSGDAAQIGARLARRMLDLGAGELIAEAG